MLSLLKNVISENRSKDREEKGAYVKMIPMLYQASESYPNNCFSVLSCCITKEDHFYLLHLRFPSLTLPPPLHFITPPHIIPHLQATNHFGNVAIGKLWGSAWEEYDMDKGHHYQVVCKWRWLEATQNRLQLSLDQVPGNLDKMRQRGYEIRPQKKIHLYSHGTDNLKDRPHSVNIIMNSIICSYVFTGK